MTDTNGAKDDTRLTPEDANEHNTVVPANGGTFGVDGDESGFGQGSLPGEAGAAADAVAESAVAGSASGDMAGTGDVLDARIDASGLDNAGDGANGGYDSSIDLSDIDRDFNADGNGASTVPAEGGTFGVTHDASGYQSVDGHANAAPYGDNFGAAQAQVHATPGFGQGEFGAFSPPAETPAMAPPQYGTETAGAKTDVVAVAALVIGIVALLLMILPSFAYMVGGGLGIVAIVLGAMRMRGSSRTLALLGAVAGCLAVVIAVATAVLVYVI